MSRQVDERVVSMQFDNSHFEKNVSTTMSTLDKLKQSLNLTGASKGLENVNSAANKVNMNGLGKGVEAVCSKFSALEVMGVTALANITNSAVNAGKRMVSALTIDPIKTGFNEYELKMNATQTIMASTGETLATVNKYLEELNAYSDQTIYSFSDMTQNIGKFTNAGVKLEDAVLAMKGISNEAAISGANANEASRAMYNLAQAISMGYVQYIDWKSIENANMATVEFKNQLLKMAMSLGTVEKAGDDAFTTLEGKTYNTMQMFKDGMKDQWLTTDVLIETLREYADETTEIGSRATKAATEVKTFTMMMDTLKESAQSGWARTWELIFGDFEQGKNLWTNITNVVGGVIDKMTEVRNTLLETALGKTFSDIPEKVKNIMNPMQKSSESVKNIVKSVEDYANVVNEILNGEWGSGQDRWDKLTKDGYDWAHAQNLVNEKLGVSKRHFTDYAEAQEKASESSKEFTDDHKKLILKLMSYSDAQLKSKGYTDEQIKSFNDLKDALDKTGVSLADFLEDTSLLDGRTLLINSFKNAGLALADVLKAVKNAWIEVFPPKTMEQRAEMLYNIIAAIHKFTTKLRLVDKETGELNETGKKFQNIFKGVFTVLKTVVTVVEKVATTVFQLGWKILKPIVGFILDVASAMGILVTKSTGLTSKFVTPISKGFKALVKVIESFAEFLDKKLGGIGKFIGEIVDEWVTKFEESEAFETASTYISGAVDAISGSLSTLKGHLEDLNFSKITGKISAIGGTISEAFETFKNSDFGKSVIDSIAGMKTKLFDTFKNFKLPKVNFEKWSKTYGNFLEFLKTNNLSGFKGGITGLFGFMKQQLSYKWDTLKNNTLLKFSEFYIKYGDTIKSGIETCKSVIKSIVEFIFGSEEISLPVIMDLMTKFLAIKALLKIINVFDNITIGIKSIGEGFEQYAKAAKWKAVGSAFLALSVALGAFTACVYIIHDMFKDDPSGVLKSVAILGGFLVVLGGVVVGMAILASKLKAVDIASAVLSVLGMAAALALLVLALKKIDETDFRRLGRSFGILAGLLITMAVSIGIVGKFCGGGTFKSTIAIVSMLTALKMVLDILEAYAEYDWGVVKRAIPQMIGMLAMLAVVLKIATSGLKEGANASGMALLMISIVIALKTMLSVIEELGKMDTKQMWQGIMGVGAILTMITAMLSLINISSSSEKAVNSFKGLAIALLGICASIYILGEMPMKTLLQGGAAVVVILGVLSTLLKAMGEAAKFKTGALLVTLIGIGLLVAEAGYIVKKLSEVGWQNALGSASALSMLLISMASCLRILSKNNMSIVNTTEWIVALAAMGLIVMGLAVLLDNMKEIDATTAIGHATALSVLLLAMSGCIAICSKIGPMASAAYPAMGALAVFVVGLGVLVGVFGALANEFEKFGPAIDTGVEIMGKLGTALGKFVGGIIGGIGKGITAQMPGMGKDLGEFMSNAEPFFTGLENIKQDTVSKATLLSETIGALGSAGISNMFANILSIGKSLPNLGTDLSNFMTNGESFFKYLETFPVEAVTGVQALADTISTLSSAGLKEAFSKLFNGNSSLATFGEQLAPFGEGIAKFSKSITGENAIDSAAVESAAKAGLMLAEMAKTIPNEGGWAATIMGENDLAEFSNKIKTYGEALVAFAGTIRELEEGDAKKIEQAATAGKSLAAMASSIPNEGGWAGEIMGENDLVVFGTKIQAYGEALVSFAGTIKDLADADIEKIKTSAQASTELATMADSIPNEGGWAATILGENDMRSFGSKLVAFGSSLINYVKTIRELTPADADKIASSKAAVDELLKVADSIPKTDSGWWGAIVGQTDIAAFGQGMINVAQALKDYINVSNSISEDDITAINNSKNAMDALVSVAESVPSESTVSYESVNSLSKSISGLIDVVVKASNADVSGISNFTNGLSKLGTVSVDTIATSFNEGSYKIQAAINSMFVRCVNTVNSNTNTILAVFNSVISSILDTIDTKASLFMTAGTNLMKKFIEGIDTNKDKPETAIRTMLKDIMLIMGAYEASFYSSGMYMVEGFADGINANIWKAEAEARAMARAAKKAAELALGICSPSKVFYKIGDFTGLGFVNALGDYADKAYRSGKEMANAARNGLNDAISKVMDVINSGIDAQPTIRPVLDLSDVQNGVNGLNGLFSGQTLALAGASVGNLKAVTGLASQLNGTVKTDNKDVINAITGLRGDVNALANAINNTQITMDSGAVVGTLIRKIDTNLGQIASYKGRGN